MQDLDPLLRSGALLSDDMCSMLVISVLSGCTLWWCTNQYNPCTMSVVNGTADLGRLARVCHLVLPAMAPILCHLALITAVYGPLPAEVNDAAIVDGQF